MTSTDSSDTSSLSSASSGGSIISSQIIMHPNRHRNPYLRSHHLRSELEMKMMNEAADSLFHSIENLTSSARDTALFFSRATERIELATQKKTMRSMKRTNLDHTINAMSDTASMVGSVAGSVVNPHGRRNPNLNLSIKAPSVLSEMSNLPFSHNMPPPRSSVMRYPSVMTAESSNQSFRFHGDRPQPMASHRANNTQQVHTTLLQAIDESEVDGIEEDPCPSANPTKKQSSQKKGNPNKVSESSKSNVGGGKSHKELSHEGKKRSSLTQQVPDSESDDESSPQPTPTKVNKTNPKMKTVPKTTSPKVVKLREWRLRVVDDHLVVAGYTSDNSRAISGPISKFSDGIVHAAKGQFKVVGQPYIGTTAPNFVSNYCKNGFPRQWKSLTKKWIAENQAKSKKTKQPRPSASSTPKSDKPNSSKKAPEPAKNAKKRLSKSVSEADSTSKLGDIPQDSVKPRCESATRSKKEQKEKAPLKTVSKEQKEKAPLKTLSNRKNTNEPTTSNPQPSTSKQVVTGRQANNGLFDDGTSDEDGDDLRIDPFANIRGSSTVPLGKMTPNSLMKSVEADTLDMGRQTPPMQRIQHLFGSGTKSMASTGSPSSLNTSRDNPVAKRMNKDLGERQKNPKKKKHLASRDEENCDPKMGDAYRFFKPTSKNVTTPNIVKKVFRNQTEDGTDDEDVDQSMVY